MQKKRWLKDTLFLLAALLLLPAGARAARNQFQKASIRVDGGRRITYWVYAPQEEPVPGLPLVVYLHGSGERGERALSGGMPALLNEGKIAVPAVCLVPQLPQGMIWGHIESQLLAMMDRVSAAYRTDENRVTLVGASLGANAVWDLAARWPDLFPRAVSVCGRVRQEIQPESLAYCHIRAYVGLKDVSVPPGSAMAFTQALMDAGYEAELFEYDAAHAPTQRKVFSDQQIIDWICWAEQETDVTGETETIFK